MTAEPRTRLLDVNALVALSLSNHAHHEVVSRWFGAIDTWATCAITQAAYVRLLLNPSVTGVPIRPADVLDGLSRLTRVDGHSFIVDDAPLSEPSIAFAGLVGPKQVTDLHLVDLVARHGAALATMDHRLVQALAPDDRGHVEVIPL